MLRFLKLFGVILLFAASEISCSTPRSTIAYNNVDYPRRGSKLDVYQLLESDVVEVARGFRFQQTKFYSQYNGRIKVHWADGKTKTFDIEWRAWVRPERIDLYIKPKRKRTVFYNVMPQGSSTIYLKDDETAVRLRYGPAKHWALITKKNGKHRLIGEDPELQLTREMDDYPILYLTYVYADQIYR